MADKDTTKEELDKTIEDLEKLKDSPKEEDDTPKEDDEPKDGDKPSADDVQPDDTSDDDKQAEKEAEPEEKEPEPDYKKKFSESSRESQKIAAKNREINKAIDEASQMDEPTDEEMKQEYPDWDDMEDFAKTMAKEATMGKKFRENLVKAREKGKKIEKWNEDVEKFVEDPETLTKYPDLEGKMEQFKEYAGAEANARIPFDVLVPAFMHNSAIPTKNKGQMFPQGSAGEKETKADNRLSIEEGRKLRETNYDEWKRQLGKGNIKLDV